ncbi:MAG: hypothetical protein JWN99_3142, partial [Ilumatobacteraceae bacterium]|nr:hypothetical protein [Ilumatobacteraceae bacterium]
IERGNASGAFHCENPHEAAWMVVALSDAYALHSQSGSALALDEMAKVTRRLTERELGLDPGSLDPAP